MAQKENYYHLDEEDIAQWNQYLGFIKEQRVTKINEQQSDYALMKVIVERYNNMHNTKGFNKANPENLIIFLKHLSTKGLNVYEEIKSYLKEKSNHDPLNFYDCSLFVLISEQYNYPLDKPFVDFMKKHFSKGMNEEQKLDLSLQIMKHFDKNQENLMMVMKELQNVFGVINKSYRRKLKYLTQQYVQQYFQNTSFEKFAKKYYPDCNTTNYFEEKSSVYGELKLETNKVLNFYQLPANQEDYIEQFLKKFGQEINEIKILHSEKTVTPVSIEYEKKYQDENSSFTHKIVGHFESDDDKKMYFNEIKKRLNIFLTHVPELDLEAINVLEYTNKLCLEKELSASLEINNNNQSQYKM